MKASEVLAQAWGLVKTMGYRGTWAVDAGGHYCSPTSPDACKVCSIGAVVRVMNISIDDAWTNPAGDALHKVAQELSTEQGWVYKGIYGHTEAPRGVAFINDHHPEFIDEMFTRAIALAKKEEASCEVAL